MRDIVTTLKTSGVTAQRIIDWSKGRDDTGIRQVLRDRGFTPAQLATFAGKGGLSKADVWSITREQGTR